MGEWRLINLNFGRSPAHFGERGIGIEETSERVRSDTLFSAWITAYAQLFGREEVAGLLKEFGTEPEPPFRLSSTFIYQELGAKTVYYLPRPKAFPAKYPFGKDLDFAKDYKKLNYLPLETWRRWYQSEEGFSEEDLQNKEVKSYGDTFKTARIPKVAIDRTTRATNFYHTGFVQFQSETNPSGLYFLLYFPEANPTLEHDLRAAIGFLGEEGIGGERSSGAGRFEVVWENLSDEWQQVVKFSGAEQHSLISMFWDSSLDTKLLEKASYELLERGGWITSPSSGRQSRRKSVQMFAEGSVFSGIPQGQLADVTPDGFDNPRQGGHKIYRSGIALSLPVKIHDSN
jgi:CRISPR-associated protein Csm4